MTKPPSLPEKEWFTLAEIAQRWGTDTDTLIHYGHLDLLKICTYWPPNDQCLAAVDTRPFLVLNRVVIGNFERNKKRRCTIRARDLRPVTDPANANRVLAEITSADLFVTRVERDRFEQEHRVGAHAGAMPKRPDDKRERRGMMNIIGALVELIKTPRPNRETDTAVIAELLDNWPEKFGISERNLKAKFAEARRSLRED